MVDLCGCTASYFWTQFFFFLTFPGFNEEQPAPFAPLALIVELVTGSDLNLVQVSSQSVRNHHWTLLGIKLKKRKFEYEQELLACSLISFWLWCMRAFGTTHQQNDVWFEQKIYFSFFKAFFTLHSLKTFPTNKNFSSFLMICSKKHRFCSLPHDRNTDKQYLWY